MLLFIPAPLARPLPAPGMGPDLLAPLLDIVSSYRSSNGKSGEQLLFTEDRGIGRDSVAELRARAMRKLGVENVADLVRSFDEAKRQLDSALCPVGKPAASGRV